MRAFAAPIGAREVALSRPKKAHARCRGFGGHRLLLWLHPGCRHRYLTPTADTLERTREFVASFAKGLFSEPCWKPRRQARFDARMQSANDFVMLEEITSTERITSVV
jgi:hypothetical protein